MAIIKTEASANVTIKRTRAEKEGGGRFLLFVTRRGSSNSSGNSRSRGDFTGSRLLIH